LADSRHHASAAGLVKSTTDPVPIHHLVTNGSPSGSVTKWPAAAAGA
jgi:hypothetical protein